MAGEIVLGIGLNFHDRTPKQAAIVLAFDQPEVRQVRYKNFCREAKKTQR